MNTYELISELEEFNNDGMPALVIEQAIDMLRQQADRIAELEKEKIRAYDNGYEDGRKQNTQLNTQLYPLSDADIEQISHRYHYTYNPDYIGFARAIEERILGK